MFKVSGWQIAKQYIGMPWGLTTNFFRDVANGEIYWIGTLVVKLCQLGLVSGNDEGDNGCTRLVTFDSLLQMI